MTTRETSDLSPLFLVRHGETVWNHVGRYQGAKDSPLTPRGREQARLMALSLVAVTGSMQLPLRAYVSPLGRAQETAAIIAKFVPLQIEVEPRIAEVSLGAWDGMSHFEIEMEYPGVLAGSTQHDWYFQAPDGESFESAFARVADWLRQAHTPSMAVTHGLASRLIRGAHLGLSRHDMLQLPVPQDCLFRLTDGRCVAIPVGAG